MILKNMSDIKVNITVLCDQVDCVHITGGHTGNNYAWENRCTHPRPFIIKLGSYPHWTHCTCHSKQVEMQKKAIVSPFKDESHE